MANSILDDTKQSLGVVLDLTEFDAEIIMHINSVLADLHQLGVGPEEGFMINDKFPTWDDFLTREGEIESEKRLNNVKSYVFLKVKMLWDPPNVGYVLTAWEKLLERMEWRINVAREEIEHPLPATPVSVTPSGSDIHGDSGYSFSYQFGDDDEDILDGGTP